MSELQQDTFRHRRLTNFTKKMSLIFNFRACVERGLLKSAMFAESVRFFPAIRLSPSIIAYLVLLLQAKSQIIIMAPVLCGKGGWVVVVVGGVYVEGVGGWGCCQYCEWKLRTLCQSAGDREDTFFPS